MRHYNGWEQIVNKNSENLMKYNCFEMKTLNGIQEVSGSIPLISTKQYKSEPNAGWRGVRICCFL